MEEDAETPNSPECTIIEDESEDSTEEEPSEVYPNFRWIGSLVKMRRRNSDDNTPPMDYVELDPRNAKKIFTCFMSSDCEDSAHTLGYCPQCGCLIKVEMQLYSDHLDAFYLLKLKTYDKYKKDLQSDLANLFPISAGGIFAYYGAEIEKLFPEEEISVNAELREIVRRSILKYKYTESMIEFINRTLYLSDEIEVDKIGKLRELISKILVAEAFTEEKSASVKRKRRKAGRGAKKKRSKKKATPETSPTSEDIYMPCNCSRESLTNDSYVDTVNNSVNTDESCVDQLEFFQRVLARKSSSGECSSAANGDERNAGTEKTIDGILESAASENGEKLSDNEIVWLGEGKANGDERGIVNFGVRTCIFSSDESESEEEEESDDRCGEENGSGISDHGKSDDQISYEVVQNLIHDIELFDDIVTKRKYEKTTFEIDLGSGDLDLWTITPSDWYRLTDNEYLGDNIVDLFSNLIFKEIYTKDQREQSHLFSSVMYQAARSTFLCGEGNLSQLLRTRKVLVNKKVCKKMFSKKFLFFPVCEDNHWMLYVVSNIGDIMGDRNDSESTDADSTENVQDLAASHWKRYKKPCIRVFNSLSEQIMGVDIILRRYLNYHWLLQNPPNADLETPPQVFTESNLPLLTDVCELQDNSSDCGLYVLHSMTYFFKDFMPKLSLSRFHMKKVIVKRASSQRIE